jgi:hypothetical protein
VRGSEETELVFDSRSAEEDRKNDSDEEDIADHAEVGRCILWT